MDLYLKNEIAELNEGQDPTSFRVHSVSNFD